MLNELSRNKYIGATKDRQEPQDYLIKAWTKISRFPVLHFQVQPMTSISLVLNNLRWICSVQRYRTTLVVCLPHRL